MELEATAGKMMKQKATDVQNQALSAKAGQIAAIGAAEREECTLWLGSIPDRFATEDAVRAILSSYGVIHKITLRIKTAQADAGVRMSVQGTPNRSWAFVTFDTKDSVHRAVKDSVQEESTPKVTPTRITRVKR
jgi:RNA recognition motif-containing protein